MVTLLRIWYSFIKALAPQTEEQGKSEACKRGKINNQLAIKVHDVFLES